VPPYLQLAVCILSESVDGISFFLSLKRLAKETRESVDGTCLALARSEKGLR